METTLNTLKNQYAQEQGYEDWIELRKELYGDILELRIEAYMDAICIRAQKAALEKAAENGLVRLNFNNLSGNSSISEKRFKIKDTPGFYEIDRASITNPENLIR